LESALGLSPAGEVGFEPSTKWRYHPLHLPFFYFLIIRKDVAYGLVIVWALVGIWIGQSGYQNIVTLAQTSSIIVLITLAVTILNDKLRK
ncbi:hypothetical protein MUO66_03880, partial [Candidatus Bathyarchaeota archaeon]|nr:hypothetical protein [Candidatus Bathyarchaeota archaeon]